MFSSVHKLTLKNNTQNSPLCCQVFFSNVFTLLWLWKSYILIYSDKTSIFKKYKTWKNKYSVCYFCLKEISQLEDLERAII